MRFLFTLLLTLSLVLPASLPTYGAGSPASAASRALSEYVKTNARFTLQAPKIDSKRMSEQLQSAATSRPKEAMVGVGQTLLLIMTLTAIDLTRQEIQLRKNRGSFSANDVKEIAKTSVNAILDNPSIYAGILGAGGIGIAQKPASLLVKMMTHPRLLRALRPVLTRLVATTITFVGWEFGSQLWSEASLRLDSEADVKRAMSVSGLGGSFIKTAVAAGSKNDHENTRVAKRMMKEMVYILLHASTLRAWFSNTLRTRVMTGEFSTLLTSMIAAGAIGTAIFPGAGTIAGGLFGLAGGVVAMFLPQGFKDGITDQFQSLRTARLRYSLSQNSLKIDDAMRPVRFFIAATRAETIAQAKQALLDRRALRSKLATISWEKLRRSVLRLNSKDLTDREFNSQWAANYAAVKAVYANDIREMARLHLVFMDTRAPKEIENMIQHEQKRLEILLEYVTKIEDEASFDDMLKLIEIHFAKGVNESEFIAPYLKTRKS
jgi:hypothetical protein